MEKSPEQQICIKFCVKNEIDASETYKMVQKCFGDDSLSKTNVFDLHKSFEDDCEAVQENHSAPSTSNTDEDNEKLVLKPHHITKIREAAEQCGVSFGSIESILNREFDLGLRRSTRERKKRRL